MHLVTWFLSAALAVLPPSAAVPATSLPTLAFLRIEGANNTIYEGPVLPRGSPVTTLSGGTHHCDGTNNGENPTPGATCTNALDWAAKHGHFDFDGTYQTQFDDFFITRISTSAQTSTQFWGLLLNYQFTPVGGCQQEIKTKDHVLWAFDAFNKNYFLKLTHLGPPAVKVGDTVKFTVTDGLTGAVIPDAVVAVVGGKESGTADAEGVVSIKVDSPGVKTFKAERSDAIRSNGVVVVVY